MKAKDNPFSEKATLPLGGNLLDLSSPVLVAPLAVPANLNHHPSLARTLVDRALKLKEEGAHALELTAFLDNKGRSRIAEDLELANILRAAALLKSEVEGLPLSVQTMRSAVARTALERGADMLSDPSGGMADQAMIAVVAQWQVPFACGYLHRAMDRNMPKVVDLMTLMLDFFAERIDKARELGIKDLILNPAFGLGKSRLENAELLNRLHFLTPLGHSVMIDFSQKGARAQLLEDKDQEQAGTEQALLAKALQEGVSLVKVNELRQAVNVIQVHQAITT